MRDEFNGRGIRALRHRRGWRQRDFSAATGIARSVIADLEAGGSAHIRSRSDDRRRDVRRPAQGLRRIPGAARRLTLFTCRVASLNPAARPLVASGPF